MRKDNFTYSFDTLQPPCDVFKLLLNIKQWWSGLYGETIDGESQDINDDFTFKAGEGAHYSKQKLIELVPDKKVVWLVTDSNLSFLKRTDEWNGTRIGFDLAQAGDHTRVTFTHEGLVPQIECYGSCSVAWTGYLDNLRQKLKLSNAKATV